MEWRGSEAGCWWAHAPKSEGANCDPGRVPRSLGGFGPRPALLCASVSRPQPVAKSNYNFLIAFWRRLGKYVEVVCAQDVGA